VKIRGRIVNKGEIPASVIRQAYIKAFKVSWCERCFGHCSIKLADETYRQVNLNQISQILKDNKTNEQKYIDNDYDCDDFTFQLMGTFHSNIDTAAMPIFICWVSTPNGGHAVISFYHNGEIFIIEPQTDEIYSPPNDWGLILLVG
jgi:hypothetical protein